METLARIAIRGGPGRYAPVTTYGRVRAVTRPLTDADVGVVQTRVLRRANQRHGANGRWPTLPRSGSGFTDKKERGLSYPS